MIRKQIYTGLILIILSFIAILGIVKPLISTSIPHCIKVWQEIITIRNTNVQKMKLENTELKQAAEKFLGSKAVVISDNTTWFDFLRAALAKSNMQAAKISSGEPVLAGSAEKTDYSIECRTDFHSAVSFINECERGPFISEIKLAHLTAHTLLDNSITVAITISFTRDMDKKAP